VLRLGDSLTTITGSVAKWYRVYITFLPIMNAAEVRLFESGSSLVLLVSIIFHLLTSITRQSSSGTRGTVRIGSTVKWYCACVTLIPAELEVRLFKPSPSLNALSATASLFCVLT
jgi:hypothetical protein